MPVERNEDERRKLISERERERERPFAIIKIDHKKKRVTHSVDYLY